MEFLPARLRGPHGDNRPELTDLTSGPITPDQVALISDLQSQNKKTRDGDIPRYPRLRIDQAELPQQVGDLAYFNRNNTTYVVEDPGLVSNLGVMRAITAMQPAELIPGSPEAAALRQRKRRGQRVDGLFLGANGLLAVAAAVDHMATQGNDLPQFFGAAVASLAGAHASDRHKARSNNRAAAALSSSMDGYTKSGLARRHERLQDNSGIVALSNDQAGLPDMTETEYGQYKQTVMLRGEMYHDERAGSADEFPEAYRRMNVQFKLGSTVLAMLRADADAADLWNASLCDTSAQLAAQIGAVKQTNQAIAQYDRRTGYTGVERPLKRQALLDDKATQKQALLEQLLPYAQDVALRQRRQKLQAEIYGSGDGIIELSDHELEHRQGKVIAGFKDAVFDWSLQLPDETPDDTDAQQAMFTYVKGIKDYITDDEQAEEFFEGFVQKFGPTAQARGVVLPTYSQFEATYLAQS